MQSDLHEQEARQCKEQRHAGMAFGNQPKPVPVADGKRAVTRHETMPIEMKQENNARCQQSDFIDFRVVREVG